MWYKKLLNGLTYIGLFALGAWFHSKFLDKPETVNKIGRLKQKKGSDNTMSAKFGESKSDTRKRRKKEKKQKRKQK